MSRSENMKKELKEDNSVIIWGRCCVDRCEFLCFLLLSCLSLLHLVSDVQIVNKVLVAQKNFFEIVR